MKKIFKVLMATIVMLGLVGCSQKSKDKLLSEAESLEWKDIAIAIAQNPVAAKEKYEGKICILTGYIGDIYDADYVELNWYQGDWMDVKLDQEIKLRATSSLRMDLNDEEVINLRTGDEVIVVGVISEISTGTAWLENGYIVD